MCRSFRIWDVLDESGTDEAECRSKVTCGRRVAGAIRSLVNAKGLQLQRARVLHEQLLLTVPMYGSETMIRKENERSRVRVYSLKNLLGIKRMDRVPNPRIMELCEVTKGKVKELMKVFLGGSAMRREWRIPGLLRESM